MQSVPLTGAETDDSLYTSPSSRCSPLPSRGLQRFDVGNVFLAIADATRAPHGGCNDMVVVMYCASSTRLPELFQFFGADTKPEFRY